MFNAIITHMIELTPMDYIRGALANGLASGLDLEDVIECAIYAETAEDFDDAVNLLGLAVDNGIVCRY